MASEDQSLKQSLAMMNLRIFMTMTLAIHFTLALASAAETDPLLTVVDIHAGQARKIPLSDGTTATVKLIEMTAERDSVMQMVKRVRVVVEVNGQRIRLESGNYQLPVKVGGVQIDCPVTRHYNKDSIVDRWGLKADARLRFWPGNSKWIRADSFIYPVKQRWMAAMTWYSNEPVSKRANGKVYYHSGMDIGATEAKAEVVSATEGVIVSAGGKVIDGDHPAVQERYDVIYIRDSRGWYYRYSHLHKFDPKVKVGAKVAAGQRLGLVGKQGASGGWSHLHFEIKSLQPSGEWGTQDSYAFLWQAYLQEHDPKVLAIARPHRRVRTGEPVTLTGQLSWARAGIKTYEWTLNDGTTAQGAEVTRRYDRPGAYCEILKVTDTQGNIDYDFATIRVADSITGRGGPGLDANYHPSLDVHAGDQLTLTSRGRSGGASKDVWDFGDGSPRVTTRSNIDSAQHAKVGYAITTHRFQKPGDYIVTVRKTNERGEPAIQRLHVHIEPPLKE